MVSSPVRSRAQQLGIEVLTPTRAGDPPFLDRLRQIAPDACPIVAYGGLIPLPALTIPTHGWVNLHFSLLPAWRGAAPVQRAIMAGDEVTGATTFLLEQGLDTGPTLGVMTEAIKPNDTSGDLLARLAHGGAELLVATLDALESGELQPVRQPAEGVSLAPKISVEDARIRWDRTALAIDRQVRGCTPAPGAWTTFRGERVKVHPVSISPDPAPAEGSVVLAPGAIVATKRAVEVGTASGLVQLSMVQPHGRKPMAAADWARGVRIEPGEKFADV